MVTVPQMPMWEGIWFSLMGYKTKTKISESGFGTVGPTSPAPTPAQGSKGEMVLRSEEGESKVSMVTSHTFWELCSLFFCFCPNSPVLLLIPAILFF